MKTHRVVVLLNEEQYHRAKILAGDVPLSAWFRATVEGKGYHIPIEASPSIADAVEAQMKIMRRDVNRPPMMSPAEWHRGPRQKGDKSR